MKWPLTAIKAATARWQALGDSGGPGPMFLTKMQWYELFNDYSVIVDGAFLTVPNEHFAVYDPSGSGSACAYQVFAVLGLFGDCYLPDKLEYLFNLLYVGPRSRASVCLHAGHRSVVMLPVPRA